jgi:hypothetical protein
LLSDDAEEPEDPLSEEEEEEPLSDELDAEPLAALLADEVPRLSVL